MKIITFRHFPKLRNIHINKQFIMEIEPIYWLWAHFKPYYTCM